MSSIVLVNGHGFGKEKTKKVSIDSRTFFPIKTRYNPQLKNK